MSWRTEPERALAPLFSLVAVFMARQGTWRDEEITLMLVDRWGAWGLLTELPVSQPHFPTYYFVVELMGAAGAEALSAVSLAVTVHYTMRASRAIHGDRVAPAVTGAAVAFSPFLAAQAGWLRMYAPTTALMTAGLCLVIENDGRGVYPLMAASVLHPFALMGLAWNAVVDGASRRSVTALGAGSVPALALAVFKATRHGPAREAGMGRVTDVTHGIEPGVMHLLVTPAASLTGAPNSHAQAALILALMLLFMTGARRHRPDVRLVLWILIPVVALAVASYAAHPVFRVKYFGFVAPAVAVLLADPRRSDGYWLGLGVVLGLLMLMSWAGRTEGMLVARRIFVEW